MSAVKKTVAEKAAAIYAAGVQPWPVSHNGTKAPRGEGWSTEDLPERLSEADTLEMFKTDDTGLGVICGKVSGNLELFEFEGRFVNSDGYNEFLSRCQDEGLGELLTRLQTGYEAVSPTGGIHLMFRTEGPALGNTKLARRPSTPEELEFNPEARTQVLIETRGEGGFAVFMGSNGKVHPSGGSWKRKDGGPRSIATISVEERSALYELASSFDEMPELQPHLGLPGSSDTDDSDLVEYIVNDIGVGTLLAEDGWHSPFTKRNGRTEWTRPGKQSRDGGSLEQFPDGGCNVYTTTHNEAWAAAMLTGSAFDHVTPIGVLAAVRHGGDIAAAMSWTRKQITGALPPQVDPETGEVLLEPGLNLPDEFWNARPILKQIRQGAWSKIASPDATLAGVIARYAALLSPRVTIPDNTLDMFFVTHCPSGVGKTSAGKAARSLHPAERKKVMLDQNVGSGEGLAEAFFEWIDEDGNKCSPSKKGAMKVRTQEGMHFATDEGQALAAAAGRANSVLIPTLCSAWMGESIGTRLADPTKSRIIGGGEIRLTAEVRIQTENGHRLFQEEYATTGLAQRMVCLSARDPLLDPDSGIPTPEWPGRLDLPTPALVGVPAGLGIDYCDEIKAEINHSRRLAHRDGGYVDPLDTHLKLSGLKLAAIFALWDDRTVVSLDDQRLAQMVIEVHKVNRTFLKRTHALRSEQARINKDMMAAQSEVTVERVKDAAGLTDCIAAIKDKIKDGKTYRPRDLTARIRPYRAEALIALDLEE